MNAEVEPRIAAIVATVEQDRKRMGVLSTGEQIAVALVLDRSELFPHGIYTILEAIERLGPDWTRAALRVQRAPIFSNSLVRPGGAFLPSRPLDKSSGARSRPSRMARSATLALVLEGREHDGTIVRNGQRRMGNLIPMVLVQLCAAANMQDRRLRGSAETADRIVRNVP
jgi:hypothetical protein